MPSAASVGSRPSGLATLLAHRALAAVQVELHLAAEKVVGVEPAEQQVGVGHGRLGAAAAIAGGPGIEPALCGPTRSELPVSDARDRAAAGADLEDVHHRDLDRQRLLIAADQRAAGRQRPALR